MKFRVLCGGGKRKYECEVWTNGNFLQFCASLFGALFIPIDEVFKWRWRRRESVKSKDEGYCTVGVDVDGETYHLFPRFLRLFLF